MENTIDLTQDYLQEPTQVTPEKEQAKKRAHEPKTEEEAAERRKNWSNGWRLYHESALVGGIHRFYEHPERIARIVHIFRGNRPIVQVQSLSPTFEYKIIFTVELDGNQRNSNRSRKNWCKRHAAYKRREWAEENLRIFGPPGPAVEYEPNSPDATVNYEPDDIKSENFY